MKKVVEKSDFIDETKRGKAEWKNGPDNLCPADSYYSSRLDKPVKLRTSEADLKKYPTISIYTMFKRTVELKPNHPALAYKSNPTDAEYTLVSYGDYWKTCHNAAKSFIKVNLAFVLLISSFCYLIHFIQ